MIIEPIAADLDLDEVEVALLHAAVGDYAAEAAVLLLANDGYWLARLRTAGLITVEVEPVGGRLWARIEWVELEAGLAAGRLPGSREELAVLRVAASLADGRPVDLADVAVALDRRTLGLVLAALAHAVGSHDHRAPAPAGHGSDTGERLGPLIAWPTRR
ncbi:hypothetical protein [Geodermatophilus obscurus]|uniref:Uncharacterized protein n=1 Tax=Geodermatophilus obscurus (strain ATCC 25078 / DSM 43160 / JCM 3152 / CCUG 61914 / KCC A-0152 / KCTC 9177 / NBRC 13315 / NRRL B-3577 / G-20) TaxID=526225 RepID=D2S7F6_GEOOG|nr:hypothetical protein [Geodermatophilus obscurus]ADB73456.1 hypothetical protein Gobs_0679 [Geodermatophilus obscurus DSM 43160]